MTMAAKGARNGHGNFFSQLKFLLSHEDGAPLNGPMLSWSLETRLQRLGYHVQAISWPTFGQVKDDKEIETMRILSYIFNDKI